MHSRATIAALVLAMTACAGSNEENRPAQAVGESHNTPQTTAGTQQQQQQRPPMAMQGSDTDPSSQSMAPQQQNQGQYQNQPSTGQNQDQSQYGTGSQTGQGQGQDQNNTQYGQQGNDSSMTGQTGSTGGQGSEAQQMGDAQIVGILSAAHKGEIEEAQLAQTKAKDAQVKKFAQMMITDHTQAMQREQRTAQRLNIKASDSDTSRKLEQDSKSKVDELKNLTGAQFDKQYMDNMVKEHTDVLVMIDSKLLPNVKNSELKTLVEGDKTKVSKHLAEARDIQRRISSVTQR